MARRRKGIDACPVARHHRSPSPAAPTIRDRRTGGTCLLDGAKDTQGIDTMSRFEPRMLLTLVGATLLAVSSSGCHVAHSNCLDCGLLGHPSTIAGRAHQALTVDAGCGEIYVDEWVSDPPGTCDSCGDTVLHGHGCLPPLLPILSHLWGARFCGDCHPDLGHHGMCEHCGQVHTSEETIESEPETLEPTPATKVTYRRASTTARLRQSARRLDSRSRYTTASRMVHTGGRTLKASSRNR